MNKLSPAGLRTACVAAAVLCALVLLPGCSKTEPPQFRLNLQGRNPDDFIFASGDNEETRASKEQNKASLDTISTVMYAFFGEPNDPYVLAETGLDARKIQMAAGPTGGDPSKHQRGLYRQHCAHCHGISGDGAGPTSAFLNPYPRDYRQGQFKFKSTERPAKPTTDDLIRVLKDGIAGTAMPSFLLLPDDEVEALVEYVKYLSIRGQVEQSLTITLLDDGNPLDMNPSAIIAEHVAPIVETWNTAESAIIDPPDRPPIDTPELHAESIAKGAELFRGQKAQCMKCHGPTGLGDGGDEQLFDDWNKVKKFADLAKQIAAAEDITDRAERRTQLKQLYDRLEIEKRSWLLPPQQLQPRNLRLGVYRFGRRPADLFRRIYAGVNGTPMPQGGANASNPSGLTSEEIWHLVDYVASLPYDKVSEPGVGRGHLAGIGQWHE
ncbi:MAG: c-type cytochrome [Planctomycetia bacterium]|nr:c-type cytochrome [Planctomycetia bacterium]